MPFESANSRLLEALAQAIRAVPAGMVFHENPGALLTAVEESDDVIFVTEPDGCVTYVNPAFEKVYGLTREDAVGRRFGIGQAGPDPEGEVWEETLTPAEGQQRGLTPGSGNEGRSVLVSTVYPVVDEEGQVRSLVSVQRQDSDGRQLGRVRQALTSVLDESVAESIVQGRLHTEKRRISLLNARFEHRGEGSDSRRPEMLIKDLNFLFQEMEPILFDYHAHVDNYLGDQIIAEFGVPVDYERHALLAVLAASKMQERIEQAALPWEMRISVASGECMVGMIGHRRQNYTAVGGPVQLASSITQSCSPGAVTVSQATFEEVSQFVEGRRRTVFPFRKTDRPQFMAQIWGLLRELDRVSDNVDLLKETGLLFMEGSYFVAAHEHLMKALELDPDDEFIKLAYAETSIKLKQRGDRDEIGEPSTIQLYEVLGMRDSLKDAERIPTRLYEEFHHQVDRVVDYPGEWILPVEALDGSLGHSRTVGFLSYVLARSLGLGQEQRAEVLEAGYLADLGKASVSHHILNRAGTLNEQEFGEIIKHPAASVGMLQEMGFRKEGVLRLIRTSHERLNGSGYPDGLSGDQIPMGTRILGVADTYAGLTAWRPYRNRWECQAACAEIRREAERGVFDPEVVDAFQKLIHGPA